jgi:25S rRNA (uracil2634-N3)-methyltransferase
MAKSKKQKSRHMPNQRPKILNPPQFKSSSKQSISKQSASSSLQKNLQQSQKSTAIPIDPLDKILLIGEGDFSFAASLVEDHGCSQVLATTNDSEETCLTKYPNTAAQHHSLLRTAYDDSFEDFQKALPDGPILYNIDATNLQKSKEVKRAAPFDWIIFNFPHVGGLSTDINRQVRANQALLAAFFKSAKDLLRTEQSASAYNYEAQKSGSGSILVTVFEGEPYSLWNVRDLARSVSLIVHRSWQFDASAFPRYRHARTGGAVRKGGIEGNELSESAWKGEQRPARTFQFGLPAMEVGSGQKRKKGDSSDEDDDEDD